MRNVTLADVMAALSALGGVVGVIFGAVNLGDLTAPTDAVITSVGGLLTAISAYHAHKIVTARAVNSLPTNPPRLSNPTNGVVK